MKQLLIEALVVGIATVVIGTIVSYLYSLIVPKVQGKNWNKYFAMETSLFLTGVVAHFFFELIGANTWYCKNGYACKK
jgi:ABC-type antimicrobial peptide transport system permease subunit